MYNKILSLVLKIVGKPKSLVLNYSNILLFTNFLYLITFCIMSLREN